MRACQWRANGDQDRCASAIRLHGSSKRRQGRAWGPNRKAPSVAGRCPCGERGSWRCMCGACACRKRPRDRILIDARVLTPLAQFDPRLLQPANRIGSGLHNPRLLASASGLGFWPPDAHATLGERHPLYGRTKPETWVLALSLDSYRAKLVGCCRIASWIARPRRMLPAQCSSPSHQP